MEVDTSPGYHHVRLKTGTYQLWGIGRFGSGAIVAILDEHFEPEEITGPEPIDIVDLSETKRRRGRNLSHGTKVADMVRAIAPLSDLILFRALRNGRVDKVLAAKAVEQAVSRDVDVIVMPFDCDDSDCNPQWIDAPHLPDEFLPTWSRNIFWAGGQVPKADGLCALCAKCWELRGSNTAFVAAAGNRWGKPSRCPTNSPATLSSVARVDTNLWDSVYESKSWIRRLWDWHLWGTVADNFGTSFSCAYASGKMALVPDLIEPHGWIASQRLIADIRPDGIAQGLEIVSALRGNDGLDGFEREIDRCRRRLRKDPFDAAALYDLSKATSIHKSQRQVVDDALQALGMTRAGIASNSVDTEAVERWLDNLPWFQRYVEPPDKH